MKLSVKSDYAARAVLGLARAHAGGRSMRVEDLARGQSIPPNYLVQILIELKARRLVKSVRGKEGGYLLALRPSEITLGDVLRAVHGQVFDTPALTDGSCPVELKQAWQTLQQNMDQASDSITFQHLVEQSVEREKMYYI